jgi:hypothetical protein
MIRPMQTKQKLAQSAQSLILVGAIVLVTVSPAPAQQETWRVVYTHPDPRNTGVNLRTEPEPDAWKIATCFSQAATPLKRDGESREVNGVVWLPVRIDGWMAIRRHNRETSYLNEVAPGEWKVSYIGKGTRTDDSIAIRSEPGTAHTLVADVYDGSIVSGTERRRDDTYEWLKVSVRGWMASTSQKGTPLIARAGMAEGGTSDQPMEVTGSARREAGAPPHPGKARLVIRETRQHDGYRELVEVYEEMVPLAGETRWPASRTDSDQVIFPVKVESARSQDGTSWVVTFSVFPNFDSNLSRVGIDPGTQGAVPPSGKAVSRALISKPATQSVVLTGGVEAEKILAILKPGMVFEGYFSNGRLLSLQAGESGVPATHFSPPHFRPGDRMAFRFHATTLRGSDLVMEVEPDFVVGADYTDYGDMAKLGPPFSKEGYPENNKDLHYYWSIEVASNLKVRVIAPLWEGRGGAGILDLESIDLGSSYEEDLKALNAFDKGRASLLGQPASGWRSIWAIRLGSIPQSQRVTE